MFKRNLIDDDIVGLASMELPSREGAGQELQTRLS